MAWRETWKISQTWDLEESDVMGAYGGQVCITAHYQDGAAMSAEQAAHLEAWLKKRKDAFLAGLSDGAGGQLRGAELGDVEAGEALAARHCGACHTEGAGGPPTIYAAGTASPAALVARIRKVDVEIDGAAIEAPNDRMPRLSEDRLTDEDLRDVLAWLTAG